MARKRVHEIAKAQGLTSKEVLAALKKAGIEATAAASSVEEEDALKALTAAEKGDGAAAKPDGKKAAAKPAASAPAQKSDGKSAAKPKAAGSKRPVRARGEDTVAPAKAGATVS